MLTPWHFVFRPSLFVQPIFSRNAIVPEKSAGSKSNPIKVPSADHSRVIGFQDPVTHQLLWFELEEGPLHYVPDLDLYFKLQKL